LPELITKRITNSQKLSDLNGELACLLQLGYETAVPALQRVARRLNVRMRRYYVLRELAWLAHNIAAGRIQAWARRRRITTEFSETLAEKAASAAVYKVVVIQKNIRRFIHYRKYSRIAKAAYKRRIHRTVSVFQAIIRGFIVRRRAKKKLASIKELAKNENADWAATQIQKIARRRIVQNTLYKSLTIRRSISKDLLTLAEKYLDHGDLWSFLKEIDDKVNRLKVSLPKMFLSEFSFFF
jgi:hypothetical protein